MPHFDPADLTKAMQVPYGDGDRVWLVVDKVRYVLQRVAPSKYIIVTVWHTRTEAPSYAKRVRRRKRKDGQARNGCELVAEDGSS